MFMCASDMSGHTENCVHTYFYLCINISIYPDVETAGHKILSFSNSG